MRAIVSFVVSLFVVCFILSGSLEAKNYIENGDFEWQGIPGNQERNIQGWYSDFSASSNTDWKYSGQKSMKVDTVTSVGIIAKYPAQAMEHTFDIQYRDEGLGKKQYRSMQVKFGGHLRATGFVEWRHPSRL